ncbi:unnamed protein product [Protopolystoma xenopodis]|uniref:Uncharacterized protein n=1 Tax=Protopolystoma xenopodis TaxID=117903 RepID=A0A3S5CHC8_9PLAT|nr:unnamed protein product [Protopolystoma xenopodis]
MADEVRRRNQMSLEPHSQQDLPDLPFFLPFRESSSDIVRQSKVDAIKASAGEEDLAIATDQKGHNRRRSGGRSMLTLSEPVPGLTEMLISSRTDADC